jgi:hypothetical protein
MTNFDHILNWKLLKGSHDFPGPEGGTCINEAAIVAAGFKYKSVRSASDCPPCFSRTLSVYLIGLNDGMSDEQRQKLMTFVTRLSGSADTPEIEQRRAELIWLRTVQRILPLVLIAADLPHHAKACAEAIDLKTAAEAAAWAAWAAKTAAAKTAEAAKAAATAAWAAKTAAWAAAWAAEAALAVAAKVNNIWPVTIEIAEEAFAIGNQATALDTALIVKRMDKIRQVETV